VDRTLIERTQRGDHEAYEQIATQVADELFRLAYRITRDVDRAEDAVQQTLVAIWTDLRGLRDVDRFDALDLPPPGPAAGSRGVAARMAGGTLAHWGARPRPDDSVRGPAPGG